MNTDETPTSDETAPPDETLVFEASDGLEQIPGYAAPVPLTPPDPTPVAEPEPAWGSMHFTTCLVCGEEVVDGARFCERCGSPLFSGAATAPLLTVELPTDPPCRVCGGLIAADGYCEQCGEPAVSERDHWKQSPASWVAGVCDRGVRHHRNEDSMALAATEPAGSWTAMVVCDGVSTASNSDLASLAAADAALEALATGGPQGSNPITGSVTERAAAWSALMDTAAEQANAAIEQAAMDTDDHTNPPSCTFVAAIVDGPLILTGWIGDSRAYWVPDEGRAEQLSVDDSWAQEMIAQGMTRAAAETAPQAHAITRWLGPDAPDVDAHTDATLPDRDGWIVVCSDGLWNYCSQPDDFAQVVREVQSSVGVDPLRIADGLVDWANAQGGRDNITVTLARVSPTSTPPVDDVQQASNPEESRG